MWANINIAFYSPYELVETLAWPISAYVEVLLDEHIGSPGSPVVVARTYAQQNKNHGRRAKELSQYAMRSLRNCM